MKPIVIYHSADYDGIFCREIARKFLPDAELIGWNFGDPPIQMDPILCYVVMDLPLDEPFGLKFGRNEPSPDFLKTSVSAWIDHHRTSIQTHPEIIPGYRIDGVAACRLAWQWFRLGVALPSKAEFVDRKVIEPDAVRLAGEYDVWDKRDPNADTFQYGLRLVEQGADFWEALLDEGSVGNKAAEDLLENGRICQRYSHKIDADIVRGRGFIMEWEELKLLCLNTARCNSLSFAVRDVPETGHDALLGFYFNGRKWVVSLYHAKHRTDLDLSLIAVKYGGGGHKGACGFTCDKLPWK